jgi:hypothetical protein
MLNVTNGWTTRKQKYEIKKRIEDIEFDIGKEVTEERTVIGQIHLMIFGATNIRLTILSIRSGEKNIF